MEGGCEGMSAGLLQFVISVAFDSPTMTALVHEALNSSNRIEHHHRTFGDLLDACEVEDIASIPINRSKAAKERCMSKDPVRVAEGRRLLKLVNFEQHADT